MLLIWNPRYSSLLINSHSLTFGGQSSNWDKLNLSATARSTEFAWRAKQTESSRFRYCHWVTWLNQNIGFNPLHIKIPCLSKKALHSTHPYRDEQVINFTIIYKEHDINKNVMSFSKSQSNNKMYVVICVCLNLYLTTLFILVLIDKYTDSLLRFYLSDSNLNNAYKTAWTPWEGCLFQYNLKRHYSIQFYYLY